VQTCTNSPLPSCFSAGDTLDETLTNAQEAILLHAAMPELGAAG
jgi:predicted RNase H-like HicB family nuclease